MIINNEANEDSPMLTSLVQDKEAKKTVEKRSVVKKNTGNLDNLYSKAGLDNKDVKPEKIIFSNKLEASIYLRLQQLATYGGENIQEILEAALTAYFVGKEEASRPLPPKVLAVLRKKYPFL